MIKRGQSATETLIVIAVLLFILIALIGVNQDILKAYNSKFKIDSASSALDDVVNAATSVYQQGVGAKTRVFVSFPSGLSNASIVNNVIKIGFDNNNFIQKKLDFNVSGSFNVDAGRRYISIESTKNFVNISEV